MWKQGWLRYPFVVSFIRNDFYWIVPLERIFRYHSFGNDFFLFLILFLQEWFFFFWYRSFENDFFFRYHSFGNDFFNIVPLETIFFFFNIVPLERFFFIRMFFLISFLWNDFPFLILFHLELFFFDIIIIPPKRFFIQKISFNKQ